jgi:hypothetical protein
VKAFGQPLPRDPFDDARPGSDDRWEIGMILHVLDQMVRERQAVAVQPYEVLLGIDEIPRRAAYAGVLLGNNLARRNAGYREERRLAAVFDQRPKQVAGVVDIVEIVGLDGVQGSEIAPCTLLVLAPHTPFASKYLAGMGEAGAWVQAGQKRKRSRCHSRIFVDRGQRQRCGGAWRVCFARGGEWESCGG